jgi:hypothetical protein
MEADIDFGRYVPILLQKSAAVMARWLPRFWERPVILLLWGAGQ